MKTDNLTNYQSDFQDYHSSDQESDLPSSADESGHQEDEPPVAREYEEEPLTVDLLYKIIEKHWTSAPSSASLLRVRA